VLRKLFGRPTHGTVVAYMALFVALGGTSFAAVALQRNSVKAKHIAGNAVTSKKVKDRSLLARDFKLGQLPQGPAGAQGPAGVQGAQGDPCSAGDPACRGPQGETGEQGAGAVKIAWTAPPSTYFATLATVGPWTISADCDPQAGLIVVLYVSGPGSVDYHVIRSDNGVIAATADSSPPGWIEDFSDHAPLGGYYRSAGTLILHSGETVAEVELHILADERPTSDICTAYGTAVPAS
jgi:hypothetical protein